MFFSGAKECLSFLFILFLSKNYRHENSNFDLLSLRNVNNLHTFYSGVIWLCCCVVVVVIIVVVV